MEEEPFEWFGYVSRKGRRFLHSIEMPNAFRTTTGDLWRAGQSIPLTLPDGTVVTERWAGSAKEERLDWWLRPGSGNQLAHTPSVAAIGTNDSGELLWADAAPGSHAFFVIVAPEPGKSYRLAKMVTATAEPALAVAIRHDRFALLGRLTPDGTIEKLTPPEPAAPPPPAQGELF
jgi:hypothetical protein